MLGQALFAAIAPFAIVALCASSAQSQVASPVTALGSVQAVQTIGVVALEGDSAETARPPLDPPFMARQSAAGLIGGMAGSLMMILPFALGEVGGERDTGGAALVAALLGYYAGSAVGVQAYSRHHGVRGSWRWTFGGAAVGGLGGPAFLLTVPVGATLGFNRTRQYSENLAPSL